MVLTFEYDSYTADKFRDVGCSAYPWNMGEYEGYGLPSFEADHLIFVDSVLDETCLDECSLGQWNLCSIGLLRTTIHCDSVCQHLIRPLYIANHFAAVNPKRVFGFWSQLLNTYGQLSDMKSLPLLKQSLGKRRQKDVDEFDSELDCFFTE